MTVPGKLEARLVSHEEAALVARTHHPDIDAVSRAELNTLRARLRQMRDRERTQARTLRRAVRGKGATRGASFPGTADRPSRRKQVFAQALKRVSREIARLEALEARAANVEAARRALSLKRAAQFPARPDSGHTANEGMTVLPSRRRRTIVPGAKIGSVSQQTKNVQARRDARHAGE
jgi:hypothetical protein